MHADPKSITFTPAAVCTLQKQSCISKLALLNGIADIDKQQLTLEL
jgi:hypothetical protein